MKRAVLYLITAYGSVFPFFVDLSRPEDVLNHTCNFYLNTEKGVSVGVWHTLPASQWEDAAGKGPEWYQETLGDGHPVIIYLHGNVGTRWDESIWFLISVLQILSAAGYHVLSLDYRGFGDSTGEPSEAGLTSDALHLYQWVKKQSRGGLVCLWGHSLGSGVATNTAVKVQEQGEFNLFHVFFQMYRFLPGIHGLLWDILEINNIEFANDQNLKALTSPLLILHAEDDNVVPYHMGLKVQPLYQISLQTKREHNTDAQVEMISYGANLGLSHSNIYLDPNLSNVVGKFLQNLRQ
uniref:AB hydrolase-1 domain-containing protein n=1 Tax=Mola mola TaxID=94237 RepID=A0A3Q3WUZ4_MOLML